jgi:ABC-type multidrug transport system fused ATPase/permease subunit
MSIDVNRIVEFVTIFNDMWSGPLQISIAIYLVWKQLGIATLAGVAAMVLLMPANGIISAKFKGIQVRLMKLKDGRTKLMNEVLNGIRVLKLYAWEKTFAGHVTNKRNEEIGELKTRAYYQAFLNILFISTPFAVNFESF